MAKNEVISNSEQLAEAIGSYMGMMEGIGQQDYMDSLLTNAHSFVAPLFDKAAVAAAMSDKQSLGHMWQYGTIGINVGGGNVKHANPLAQKARLWKHVLTGTGRTKNISFVFLPSTSIHPPHDPTELGINPADMPGSLAVNTGRRRYKFPNKAFVYESGQVISVAARHAKRLFVPLKTEGMPADVKGDGSKGFVWAKTHTYSPGNFVDATGAFTGLFGAWWGGTGSELMFKKISSDVERDIVQATSGIRPSRKMTKVQASAVRAATERGKRKTRKQWTLKVRHEIGERAETIL